MPAETPEEQPFRVTTGIVYREIGNLQKLVDAHFETVKVQLNALSGLPERVNQLDRRLSLLEDANSDRDIRLARLFSIASLIVAILALIFH